MRICFMGTPREAVPPLVRLVRAGFEVALCVTRPDAPAGRGQKPTESPVKAAARSLGLETLLTADVNALSSELAVLSLDAFVVVAFGQILSPALLALPRLGAFNLHFSLLPKYRGAAPVQRALLAGENVTGATVMVMNAEVDAGDILLQHACPIRDDDNTLTLKMKLSWLGADLLLKALALAETGSISLRAQPRTPTPLSRKLRKEELAVNWHHPSRQIWGLVRACAPQPGAFTCFGSKRIKVLQARPVTLRTTSQPGEVLSFLRDGILVATGDGGLLLEEVQPEGKRRMAATDFLQGANLKPGDSFAMCPEEHDG